VLRSRVLVPSVPHPAHGHMPWLADKVQHSAPASQLTCQKPNEVPALPVAGDRSTRQSTEAQQLSTKASLVTRQTSSLAQRLNNRLNSASSYSMASQSRGSLGSGTHTSPRLATAAHTADTHQVLGVRRFFITTIALHLDRFRCFPGLEIEPKCCRLNGLDRPWSILLSICDH
jgi:hypothetical protein